MLATSLVFSSLLPLPSTVLSPTNSHVLNTVRHVKSIKNFHVATAYHDIVEKISTDVIHPNVSDDHGLLLQVVLAVHGVVYNQLTCADCLQKCWKYEKTHMSTTITTEYHSLVNENFNLCDTSYVRYLPGLLLLVVLAAHRELDWSTKMFFESPFHGYPTCLIFAHVVSWSTALWTARTTRRRRPGRYLTSGCITSVEIFFY